MASIYGLFDPLEPSRIRYVGVTRGEPYRRVRDHISEAQRTKADGSWALPVNHRRAWLRMLSREGRRPDFTVLEVVLSSERRDAEHKWIIALSNQGHDLTNATTGKEGPENYKPKDAAKRRNSLSQLRRFSNPDEIQRSREITTKLWTNEDYRAKVTNSVKRSWEVPERREVNSRKMREHFKTDAGRVHREALAAACRTPHFREITSARVRGSKNPMAKLTKSDVVAIRAMLSTVPRPTQVAVARKFGVSQSLVSLISQNKIWDSS